MIRVLNVLYGMNRGGMETFIMNIYRNIDRSKVQFDFLLHTNEECSYNQEIRELGGKIFNISPRNKGIKKNKKELKLFFKKNQNYDVVHQHVSSLTYIEPIIEAKKRGIPIRIIHGHNTKQTGSSIHKYLHFFNKKRIERFATDYWACSDLAAEWMYKGNKKKYKIVNNSIDSKKFIFSSTVRDEIRDSLNLKGKFVIGHVGRFHKQKNHKFLIDVFSEINKMTENSKLLLIGSGKERKEIEEYVEMRNLSDEVLFLGERLDVEKLFQAMDAFVFPSIYEGLGIVLIEAQAAGLKTYTSEKVVPEAVKITELLKFISLKNNHKKWAEIIVKEKEYDRQEMYEEIVYKNYDVYKNVQIIQKYYLKNEGTGLNEDRDMW